MSSAPPLVLVSAGSSWKPAMLTLFSMLVQRGALELYPLAVADAATGLFAQVCSLVDVMCRVLYSTDVLYARARSSM